MAVTYTVGFFIFTNNPRSVGSNAKCYFRSLKVFKLWSISAYIDSYHVSIVEKQLEQECRMDFFCGTI